MAYKYLNDNGLKAYTKKVKGALKDLHTPIAISSENTTESKVQNVRNIADFVAKAKAAGIADENGMAVSCIIDNDYSGVLTFYKYSDNSNDMYGVSVHDDPSEQFVIRIDSAGYYTKTPLVTPKNTEIVTSSMLTQGARKPIILTLDTTEVDEETYQKLLVDDVDVVFKLQQQQNATFVPLVLKIDKGSVLEMRFALMYQRGSDITQNEMYIFVVSIKSAAPHTCNVKPDAFFLDDIISSGDFINKSTLSPVLQEIDLTGTDAERKAKLDKFEADWKALTGASDLTGARFVGNYEGELLIMAYSFANAEYEGICYGSTQQMCDRYTLELGGSLTVTHLFSHLEPVEIFSDNSAESKKKNLDNLNAYKENLAQLGISNFLGINIPVKVNYGVGYCGFLTQTDSAYFSGIVKPNTGAGNIVSVIVDSTGNFGAQRLLDEVSGFTVSGNTMGILNHIASLYENTKSLQAFGAIELKASDNAANKAALTAYKKILTYASIRITNGYSVPVRITGNAQEYHGMLNIGTGALLSGIVTDVNETHHYPFNVSTADGAITFDANNYFLEKTSNEVTEMLDAIKYSYTPVPLTATTSTNKTQLDLFLSKVPNAQVMHCTYKDVYAGTLHKINGSWYGVLVGESNTLAGQLSIKLQADGTIVEGTA